MENQILNNNGSVVYYVVMVNGTAMSAKHNSHMLAEMEMDKLSPELKAIAEVIPVTADGKQVLFG